MPLGTEVGLSLGDTVLDEDPTPPQKGAQQPPTFRTTSIVALWWPIAATAELLFISVAACSLLSAVKYYLLTYLQTLCQMRPLRLKCTTDAVSH